MNSIPVKTFLVVVERVNNVMDFESLKAHMGKLIGINIVNQRFMVGQLIYNVKRKQFILASELLFDSFTGYNSRIIESDYFYPEDVLSIETHCKPDFEVSWEDALNVRSYRELKIAYKRFRKAKLLPEFKW